MSTTRRQSDEVVGTAGVRRDLAAAAVTVALLLLIAALAAVWAPTSVAVEDGDADGDGATPARLDAGRAVLLSAPVAHMLGGALASGHREPDGDDHDIDPNAPAAPPRQFIEVRAAGDAAAAVEVRVERRAVAFTFCSGTTSAGSASSPRAATSRAPPLST